MIQDSVTHLILRERNIILSITISIRQQKMFIIIISSILKREFISTISTSQGAYRINKQTSLYSILEILGTSTSLVLGITSSYFLPPKISMPMR